VFLGNIVDKLHYKYCLTYTCTAEQTDFTAFQIRSKQVDYLDTRKKYLFRCREVFEFWRVAVNTLYLIVIKRLHTVDSFADYIEQTPFDLTAHGHRYRSSEAFDLHTAADTVCRVHSDTANSIFADMLLHFDYQFFAVLTVYLQGIVYLGHSATRLIVFYVYYRSDDLRNTSFV